MRDSRYGHRSTTARARPAPLAPLALTALALTLALACAHPASTDLTALCEGKNVARNVVLVMDSVTPAGGDELRNLHDERFDIVVNLFNPPTRESCESRGGEASIEVEDLPDELASAASRAGTAHWRLEGVNVVIDLNRGVYDNNLTLTLPLDGSDGSWTLSRFPGVVASGRLLTREQ